MCLGTFSRLARSLATIYICAQVRIFGTLVPFCVTGNSSEFPVTQKMFGMVETNVLASNKVFGYNVLGISLQNGQTFLPTAKLVDDRLCSQIFFIGKHIL